MEGSELAARLDVAERSQRWLAARLQVSHTQVKRWITGEAPIPQEKAMEARAVLPPVPPLDVLVHGAIVRPRSEKDAHRRLKVRMQTRWTGGPRPPRCKECGRVLEANELIAADIHGNGWDLCLEHVVPAIETEGSDEV